MANKLTVQQLMAGKNPSAEFEGWVTNDDMVLAIDTSGGAKGLPVDPKEYSVLQMGISGLDAQMNPITQDKQYIRGGQSTQKTGTQRTFDITADRYVGDDAQDYCIDKKYDTGNDCVVPYVYFNALTGKGEKGKASIVVNSDGGGNAGESAAVSISLKKIGDKPEPYTYSPA